MASNRRPFFHNGNFIFSLGRIGQIIHILSYLSAMKNSFKTYGTVLYELIIKSILKDA